MDGEPGRRPHGAGGAAAMSRATRVRLASRARLRRDGRTGGDLLLYPERGLALNGTASAVLRLCTSERAVGAIVDEVAVAFGQAPEAIETEVIDFLRAMVGRGLVETVG